MNTLILEKLIGQQVVVRNVAHDEMDEGRLTINFEGKLEHNDDKGYYVRVADTRVAGACGIGFSIRNVKEIRKLFYGTAIVLN
jgi:hypothetical protein